MFIFVSALLKSIFKVLLSKKKDIIFTLILLRKENEIYKRQLNLRHKSIKLQRKKRLFFSLISPISARAISHLTLVKPSTILDWQKRFIKNYWTYEHKVTGRKPVSKEIKDLILEMKTENQLWGCHRIAFRRISREKNFNL